ncbi:hypothetical protein EK904_004166 [Melospiza melodia maxima]|nr:hypothetical protein EK904_004166 [Melospiza melodia maxima]
MGGCSRSDDELLAQEAPGNNPKSRLSYRTGQDTANCDTCRNSACIIYSPVQKHRNTQSLLCLPFAVQLLPQSSLEHLKGIIKLPKCILWCQAEHSVELDFKQQEDKLQPVLRKLHPIEETQVAPLPYSQESYSSTPKQKSKTESKKHGRWKLWFL